MSGTSHAVLTLEFHRTRVHAALRQTEPCRA